MTRYTADIDDEFFADLDGLCAFLKCSKSDLLGVMMSESGVSSSAKNPTSSATGLIQFMANNRGQYYGMTRDEFAGLRPSKQLTFVRAYMTPHIGKLTSDAALYLAVFMPALIGRADDSHNVVAAKEGPYGWAFNANKYFDFNNDNAIQVGELSRSIKRQCVGPRWSEIASRAGLKEVATGPTQFDLSTILGVQQALADLGFNPGPQDGMLGPRTISAVKVFQAANRLKVDGMPGVETAAALRYFLKT